MWKTTRQDDLLRGSCLAANESSEVKTIEEEWESIQESLEEAWTEAVAQAD